MLISENEFINFMIAFVQFYHSKLNSLTFVKLREIKLNYIF